MEAVVWKVPREKKLIQLYSSNHPLSTLGVMKEWGYFYMYMKQFRASNAHSGKSLVIEKRCISGWELYKEFHTPEQVAELLVWMDFCEGYRMYNMIAVYRFLKNCIVAETRKLLELEATKKVAPISDPIVFKTITPSAQEVHLDKMGGISKREYYAAMAMQGMLASGETSPRNAKAIAEDAALIADTLITKLSKPEDK